MTPRGSSREHSMAVRHVAWLVRTKRAPTDDGDEGVPESVRLYPDRGAASSGGESTSRGLDDGGPWEHLVKVGRVAKGLLGNDVVLASRRLPGLVSRRHAQLSAELNVYYDVAKCGIGFHGDAERYITIGLRIGVQIPFSLWLQVRSCHYCGIHPPITVISNA